MKRIRKGGMRKAGRPAAGQNNGLPDAVSRGKAHACREGVATESFLAMIKNIESLSELCDSIGRPGGETL